MKDAALPWLDNGTKGIQAALAKRVKRRKLTQWNADVIAERLTPTLDYSKIANSDIIIEAVPEVLDLKHRVSSKAFVPVPVPPSSSPCPRNGPNPTLIFRLSKKLKLLPNQTPFSPPILPVSLSVKSLKPIPVPKMLLVCIISHLFQKWNFWKLLSLTRLLMRHSSKQFKLVSNKRN